MIQRPQVIGKLLNIIEQKSIQNNDNNMKEYFNFLTASRRAQENPDGLSLKLGWHQMHEKERIRSNCSLCVIFFFYVKTTPIHAKAGKGDSYEDIESARQSISFFELLLLCRDFRLIPNIITKEELHYLWHLTVLEKVQQGYRFRRLMSFEFFKHFLGRVAILAFNKPGMKRILHESGGGRVFTAEELIGFLARYMHLDDIQWVRHRVRTVGKTTVGLINFKVVGEANQQTYQHLRDDLKGIRLARIMTIEDGDLAGDNNSNLHSYNTNMHTRIIQTDKSDNNPTNTDRNTSLTKILSLAENENNLRENNTSEEHEEKSFAKTAQFLSQTAARQQGKGMFTGLGTISEATKEDDIGGNSITSQWDRGKSDSIGGLRSTCGSVSGSVSGSRGGTSVVSQEETDAFTAAMESLQVEAELTTIDLQEYLDIAEEENARLQSEGRHALAPLETLFAPSAAVSLHSAPPRSSSNGTHRQSSAQHVTHGGVQAGGVAIKGGLVITASQVEAVKAYNPCVDHSADFLDRFSNTKAFWKNKSHTHSSFNESNESTSGYLDMGTLAIGTKVIIRLGVTNETAHNVKVNIHTQGLCQEGVSNVTSLPSMVAAGLGFFAYVAFTVESLRGGGSISTIQSENVLGFVTVASHWPMEPTMQSTSVYPIFFRTKPPTTIANQMKVAQLVNDSFLEYPLCCPASIHGLLQSAEISDPSTVGQGNDKDKENQTRGGSSSSSSSQASPRRSGRKLSFMQHRGRGPGNGHGQPLSLPVGEYTSTVTRLREEREGQRAPPHSAPLPLQPSAPSAAQSSSALAVNTIVKRRYSMSSKVLMKKQQHKNDSFQQGDYIGL